jgi:hypothetical protein
MSQIIQKISSWRIGVAVGAVAFGLVCLPAALANDKVKTCKKEGDSKMCNSKGKSECIHAKNIAQKQEEGYTFPAGGGDNPCAGDPVSPT